MNQKIKTSVGTAVLVIIAITAGVFVWMAQKKNSVSEQAPAPISTKPQKTQPQTNQQKDETASWQTYKNDQFGYELKYPADWVTKNEKIVSANGAISSGQYFSSYPYAKMGGQDVVADNPKNSPNGFILSVYIFSNPNKISIDNFPNDKRGLNHSPKLFLSYTKQKININGNDFIKEGVGSEGCGSEEVDGNTHSYYAAAGDKVIELSGSFFQKDYKTMAQNECVKYQATFEKILSTFKFTDETADWQTYRNEKYGLELKYPANWFAVESERDKRVYFQNLTQEDFDKLERAFPDSLRIVWISYDQNESNELVFLAKNYANLKKDFLDINGIKINIYEHGLAETSETFLDAFWKSKSNQLYSASTSGGGLSTENGTKEAEAEQVKILKKMLSTFKFIN